MYYFVNTDLVQLLNKSGIPFIKFLTYGHSVTQGNPLHCWMILIESSCMLNQSPRNFL